MTLEPDVVRKRLEAERERLETVRGQIDTDISDEELLQDTELSSMDQHPAEAGTETHDFERDESIRDSVEAELREVDDAFARLDAGTYGRCEVDGEPIPDERLQAVPLARRCATHQAELERS